MLQGKKANLRVGGSFDPIPMGMYTVQIADVNWVTQFNKWKSREEDMLNYQFVVLDDNPMPEKEGEAPETTRGRFLWHKVSQSLGKKAWLLKLAEAAVGRPLTPDELGNNDRPGTFDPESIIGKQVYVMVEQAPNADNTKIFNNIVSYGKAIKQLAPITDLPTVNQKVVERTSVPTTAPATAPETPESFINGLEAENKAAKAKPAADEGEDPDVAAAEAEAAAAEAAAKAAAAKAKAAKLKAGK